jgi:hypothetical protein
MRARTQTTRSRHSSRCAHWRYSLGPRALGALPDRDVLCAQAGRSPLHLAAAGNFTDVVVLLLGAGADPNAQNSVRDTYACEGQRLID